MEETRLGWRVAAPGGWWRDLRSPNGERKVGARLRRALVCEEGTT